MKPKSPVKQKRWKKRFIILGILTILVVLVALWHLDYVGNDYEMQTGIFCESEELNDVVMKCSKDDIVVMTDYYLDKDNQIVISLSSDEQGETDATFTFRFNDADDAVINDHFEVNAMDSIIENRSGVVNFSGFFEVTCLFMGLVAVLLIVLIYSFVECIKKSRYSYSMIAYGGTALYIFGFLGCLVYKILNNVVTTFGRLLFELDMIGTYFLSVMMPLMFVMAISVSVSNIWLLRHEGYRPVNALGIAFSVVWFIGICIVMRVGVFGATSSTDPDMFDYISSILVYVIIYFECLLLSTAVCAFLASRHTPPLDRDYIIILGCCIRKDGTLTPLLKGRVDSALQFEKRQYQQKAKHAVFVPSGGQGSDECISEGEAMERYLKEQGIPAEQILREDKSTNTFENMKFSKEVIENADKDFEKKKIAFSTTNYHVFRGYILSKKNKFDAQGISAKTKWYFFPNAFLREFIGLLVGRLAYHIVFLVLLVLAVVFIEFII